MIQIKELLNRGQTFFHINYVLPLSFVKSKIKLYFLVHVLNLVNKTTRSIVDCKRSCLPFHRITT